MKNMLLLLLLSGVVLYCEHLPAQDKTQQEESQPPGDSAAQEEARKLENVLVLKVRELLNKQDSKKTAKTEPAADAPEKATMPEPEPYDKGRLADEIDDWESKALSFTEGLKLQELAELAEKQQEQVKKLAEKILGQERVVVNPNRRPGELKEGARLEKLFDQELVKLRRKHEQEKRKIEQEYKREKENIEKTARKLKEAVKAREKQEGSDRPKKKPERHSRSRREEKEPSDRKTPPKRGKR